MQAVSEEYYSMLVLTSVQSSIGHSHKETGWLHERTDKWRCQSWVMPVRKELRVREKLSEDGDWEEKSKRKSDDVERHLEGSNSHVRKMWAVQSSSWRVSQAKGISHKSLVLGSTWCEQRTERSWLLEWKGGFRELGPKAHVMEALPVIMNLTF